MVESGPMSSTKAIPLMPLAAPSVAQARARTCGGSDARSVRPTRLPAAELLLGALLPDCVCYPPQPGYGPSSARPGAWRAPAGGEIAYAPVGRNP